MIHGYFVKERNSKINFVQKMFLLYASIVEVEPVSDVNTSKYVM